MSHSCATKPLQSNMTTVKNVQNQSGDSMTSNSTRRRRWAMPVAAVAAFTVLSGCAKDAPQDTWQPAGENARKIHDLQVWPFGIAGIVLLIVCAAVGYSVFKFRDRGQAIPKQSHGKPSLEIALTVLPALILIGIGIPTVSTLFDLAKTSDTECVVNVTGQQWWWEYDYPAQAGCGGIEKPIVTSGQLVIPAGQHVLLRISSRDVIHSYWIPKLNGKRDAVPGRVQTLRMQADQPGIYSGQCTEFCGLSHAYMRMEAVSLDAAGDRTMTERFIAEILPRRAALSILWLGEPDHIQHECGLGDPEQLRVLAEADRNAGMVMDALAGDPEVLLIVASDHGHETVTGVIDVEAALAAAGLKQAPDSDDVISVSNVSRPSANPTPMRWPTP